MAERFYREHKDASTTRTAGHGSGVKNRFALQHSKFPEVDGSTEERFARLQGSSIAPPGEG